MICPRGIHDHAILSVHLNEYKEAPLLPGRSGARKVPPCPPCPVIFCRGWIRDSPDLIARMHKIYQRMLIQLFFFERLSSCSSTR
jgi:hypothetical protein